MECCLGVRKALPRLIEMWTESVCAATAICNRIKGVMRDGIGWPRAQMFLFLCIVINGCVGERGICEDGSSGMARI